MTDESAAARLKQAAVQMVVDEGLAGLTVEGLCRRAGATRAEFDQHWSDPGDVLRNALDERMRLPEIPDLGGLADDLTAYLDAYLARCSDPTFIACVVRVLANSGSDRKLGRKLRADFIRRRAANRILIERAVARRDLPADTDPDAILDGALKLAFTWMAAGQAPASAEVRTAVEGLLAREARARAARSRMS